MAEPYRFETQRLWPDPDSGPWYVVTYWTEFDGQLAPYGVTLLSDRRDVEPSGSMLTMRRKGRRYRGQRKDKGPMYQLDPHRLTMDALRGMGLTELWKQTALDQAEFHSYWAAREDERRDALEARAGQWRDRPATGRPRRWTAEELKEIAQVYEQHPRKPIKAVIDWYWEKHGLAVSEDGARKWIRRGRELGLLPPIAKKEGQK